jgi:hypothetical protein
VAGAGARLKGVAEITGLSRGDRYRASVARREQRPTTTVSVADSVSRPGGLLISTDGRLRPLFGSHRRLVGAAGTGVQPCDAEFPGRSSISDRRYQLLVIPMGQGG